MNIVWKSRILVFILSFIVWILLASPNQWPDVVIGMGAAFLVAGLTGGILLNTGRSLQRTSFYYIFAFLGILIWEMAQANLEVAKLVLSPGLPIKPGFVRIKTELLEDTSITVLANSITLTPGTLTVDVDQSKKYLYIHCIMVHPTDLSEDTTDIGTRFKTVIKRFMR